MSEQFEGLTKGFVYLLTEKEELLNAHLVVRRVLAEGLCRGF